MSNNEGSEKGALRVVIIGAGFAGLKLARSLNNKKGFDVLLIDKNNYHQFQPLLYQVATAGLEATNISFPLRKIFHNSKNVRIRIADVLEIDRHGKHIFTNAGIFHFDVLVICTGTTTNFFNNDHLKKNALPMKSTLEALRVMNRLINNFEDAINADSDEIRAALMSVAIVGAGPTGVELAGAIAELKRNVLPKDYPDLNMDLMKVYLLDRSVRPLASMSERSGDDAKRYLEELGIEFRLHTGVDDFNGKSLALNNGETINVYTVIWAAGVRGCLPPGLNTQAIGKGGRVKVDRFHKVIDTDSIYAIGDIALMESEKYPAGHPQLASVAGSQAKHLARNLIAIQKGGTASEYNYQDKGVMATIGKRKAVVDLQRPAMHLNGRIAWFLWMFVHLMLILGTKNKVQVFINWVYKYFTSDQNLRLAQRREQDIDDFDSITTQPEEA